MPLLQKLKDKVANGDNLEKELDLVRNNGGIILVDKDTNTIFVNSLWVQTTRPSLQTGKVTN